MACEKEIKAANKIADGWLATSKSAENYFINYKKEHIKWEKDETKSIHKLIENKDLSAAIDRIDSARKSLAQIKANCEKKYKEHADFILKGPRAGSAGICDSLKIGKKDNCRQAVMDSMKKTLLKHTKQFKSTEMAWTKDVAPRIDLLESKLDTMEKIAAGDEKKMTAYGKQIVRDTKAYVGQMTKAVDALKPSMAELAIKSVTADPANYLKGIEKMQKDQYKVFSDRVDLIEKIRAISTKNHSRVLKSIPDDVKQKFMFQRALKTLDLAKDKIEKDLNEAKQVFKTAMAVFEKNFSHLK